jgi:hypothetical protein
VPDYSIWVLEYGYVDRFPASNLFAAQPNEGHRRLPYCFALVRSADRCLLADCGCAGEFPDAHLYIQRREITEYQAALALPRRFEFLTRSCEPTLPGLLAERGRAGLATLAEGELTVAPGVVLWPAFGSHTAGSQVISVQTETNGRWLLAGDNVYAYENVDGLHVAEVCLAPGHASLV